MQETPAKPLSRLAALALTSLLAACEPVLAATHTWTGLSDGSWASAANWNGGVPASAADTAIVFDSAATPTSTVDIAGGLVLNSILFSADSGPRTVNGVAGTALIFDGDSPSLTHLNAAGSTFTSLTVPITVNQTLTLNGTADFTRQVVFGSSAVIAGAGGLHVQSGVFAMNASNTYSGPTLVSGGVLGGSALTSVFGNTSSVTVQSGGAIQLFGTGTVTVTRPLFLAGQGDGVTANYALAAGGSVDGNGNTKAWTGDVTLMGASTMRSFNGSPLVLSGASPLKLNGHTATLIAGPNANDFISLVKPVEGSGGFAILASSSGGGVNLLSDSNTFAGPIHVSSGLLGVSSNAALGDAANVLTLDGGGLRAQSALVFSTELTIPASRTIQIGPGGATFSGRATPSSSEALVLQTSLSGANPIRIERSVRFEAANTLTGPLTIAAGANLTIASVAALGSATSQVRFDGTSASPAVLRMPTAISLAAGRTFDIVGATGRIEAVGGSEILSTITGTGELQLSQSGSGTVVLGAANSHSGGTRLLGNGFFEITSDAAFGASDGQLKMAGPGIKAGASFSMPATRQMRVETSLVEVDTNGFHLVVNSDIADGDLSPGFTVAKRGGGKLLYNGQAPDGHFLVASGGFGGVGRLKHVTLREEASFSPGQSAGLFTATGDFRVTYDSEYPFAVQMLYELGGTVRGSSYDAVDVGGTAQLDGSLVLQFIGGFQNQVMAGDTFALLDAGSLSGQFANIANGERLLTDDGAGTFVVHYGPGSIYDPNSVVLSDYVAVPEPGMLGLLPVGFVVLLRRRHHRSGT